MTILANRKINAGDEKYALIILIFGIVGLIWQLAVILKYRNKRKHTTKRINAIITEKKVVEYNQYIRYVYTFLGTDEYKGITFYDRSAKVKTSYKEGKKVSLYINPQKVEQFWFEEEEAPNEWSILLMIILILTASLVMARALSKY